MHTPLVQVHWQDKMSFKLRNLDEAHLSAHLSSVQGAYAHVGASWRLNGPDGSRTPWYAEPYVRNAFEKRTRTWVDIQDPDKRFTIASCGDSRMLGVRVGTSW